MDVARTVQATEAELGRRLYRARMVTQNCSLRVNTGRIRHFLCYRGKSLREGTHFHITRLTGEVDGLDVFLARQEDGAVVNIAVIEEI